MKDINFVKKRSPDPRGISGGAVSYAYIEEGKQKNILKAINFAGIGNEYLQNPALLKRNKNGCNFRINKRELSFKLRKTV